MVLGDCSCNVASVYIKHRSLYGPYKQPHSQALNLLGSENSQPVFGDLLKLEIPLGSIAVYTLLNYQLPRGNTHEYS